MEKRTTTQPMEVVLIANEKGGVGKTTTTLNLANCLTAFGYKVLVLDMDPSANLSAAALQNDPALSLYDVFDGRVSLPEVLVDTPFGYVAPSIKVLPGLDGEMSAPNSKSLTQIANRLLGVRGGEYMLSAHLRKSSKYNLEEYFDFVLIDSAPSDNILILNSIVAADSVIVPVELSASAVNGLQMFLGSIATARDYYRTNVGFDGMLVVKYAEDTSSDRTMAKIIDQLCQQFQIPRYATKIRYSATMRSAMDTCRPILDFISNGHGAVDSLNMTLEFLRKRNLTPLTDFPGIQTQPDGNLVYIRPTKAKKEG